MVSCNVMDAGQRIIPCDSAPSISSMHECARLVLKDSRRFDSEMRGMPGYPFMILMDVPFRAS
jgi:sugar diacid utilization regulator